MPRQPSAPSSYVAITKRFCPYCSFVPFLAVLSLQLIFSKVQAQVGFPNITRTEGELLTPGGFGWINGKSAGRGAMMAFHGGYLYTVPEGPSSIAGSHMTAQGWDISNEAHFQDMDNLGLLQNFGTGGGGVNSHGFTKMGDYLLMRLGGSFIETTGFQSYNAGNFPHHIKGAQWPDARGRVYPRLNVANMYWTYHTPVGNMELKQYDLATNTWEQIADWDHLGQTGVIGHPILMGEWMIMASEQSRTGVAIYDMSDNYNRVSMEPSLIGLYQNGPIGGYWPDIWGDGDTLYVVFPRRGADSGYQIMDVSDPSNMSLVVDKRMNINGMYLQFQDEFCFIDNVKINVLAPADPVLVFDEASDNADMSQFTLPVGNLLVSGGLGGSHSDQAWRIWAHQAAPDTRAPKVGYHRPRPGQSNYPARAPISILIHETLRSETINTNTFKVLEVNGAGQVTGSPLPGIFTFAYNDILTWLPDAPFKDNTTYEVQVVAGGIEDVAGNGIEGYTFRFSTGSSVQGGNQPPVIHSFSADQYPLTPGNSTSFTINASDPEGNLSEVRVQYGDGVSSAWLPYGSSFQHTYSQEGHFSAFLQVKDAQGRIASKKATVTVMNPIAGTKPTQSAQMAIDTTLSKLWVVNPDNDTVSVIDAVTRAKIDEVSVGKDPRSVVVVGNRVWVACRDSDRIDILDTSNHQIVNAIDLEYGDAPVSLALSPDGTTVFAALAGSGYLLSLDAASLAELSSLHLGPNPRAIAITSDGKRALVTRLISKENHGVVWDVNLSQTNNLLLTREIKLHKDRGFKNTPSGPKDGNAFGRGIPNYLTGIVISPDDKWAWVTAKKDNTDRGAFFKQSAPWNEAMDTDNTVRAMVALIDLSANVEPVDFFAGIPYAMRRDIDNSDSPSAVTLSPLGDYAFITLQGTNQVVVYDALEIYNNPGAIGELGRLGTDLAPQSLLLDPARNFLYSKNLTDRSVTAFNVDPLLTEGGFNIASQSITTVASEKMTAEVKRGKQIFYNAGDSRMSAEGYISCATCHLDGGHDGRVWDFTQRGEGLRNSTDLRGRSGMGHGNVHWTGNFDEIQDFILDMVNQFGGEGFPAGVTPHASLDVNSNAGDPDLDALAAYVDSLGADSYPKSPYRNIDGSMTAEALTGKDLFEGKLVPSSGTALNCAQCHDPSFDFTDSRWGANVELHDVGTLRASSGQRMGQPLSGIVTPTLIGVWDGAPFFHDGAAETIDDVFVRAGGELLQAEDGTLSGSAGIPHSQNTRYDSSMHGELVHLNGPGSTVEFQGVDGGVGGIGSIEIRVNSFSGHTGYVEVNGSSYPFDIPNGLTRTDWVRMHIPNVAFQAGTSNTVKVVSSGWIFMDEILISNPNHLQQAQAHRQLLDVKNANPAEYNQVIQYLLQLDGQNVSANVDSDADGVNDMIERAFAMDPEQPGDLGLPELAYNGLDYEMSFKRDPGAYKIAYIVECTEDLRSGEWHEVARSDYNSSFVVTDPSVVTQIQETGSPTLDTLIKLKRNSPRVFMRVRMHRD